MFILARRYLHSRTWSVPLNNFLIMISSCAVAKHISNAIACPGKIYINVLIFSKVACWALLGIMLEKNCINLFLTLESSFCWSDFSISLLNLGWWMRNTGAYLYNTSLSDSQNRKRACTVVMKLLFFGGLWQIWILREEKGSNN